MPTTRSTAGPSGFGVRKLEVRGDRFFLNNQPFFIRGYGDDYIYPLTLTSPPRARYTASTSTWPTARASTMCAITRTPKSRSFTMPRTKRASSCSPNCRITGNSVTNEFRFDPKRDLAELMTHCRRYVSLATYCMGNEGSLGTPLDNELYQMVKQSDPGRLVLHQDGGRGNTKENSDFRPGPISTWAPGSFACDAPYVAHEYLNLGLKSDPRLDPRFTGPYAPANDLAILRGLPEARGAQPRVGRCLHGRGPPLQRYYQKQGLESARLDPACDGYCFWTIVDVLVKQRSAQKMYAGQGLYNAFWEPKSGGATPEDFRKFNGPTALC